MLFGVNRDHLGQLVENPLGPEHIRVHTLQEHHRAPVPQHVQRVADVAVLEAQAQGLLTHSRCRQDRGLASADQLFSSRLEAPLEVQESLGHRPTLLLETSHHPEHVPLERKHAPGLFRAHAVQARVDLVREHATQAIKHLMPVHRSMSCLDHIAVRGYHDDAGLRRACVDLVYELYELVAFLLRPVAAAGRPRGGIEARQVHHVVAEAQGVRHEVLWLAAVVQHADTFVAGNAIGFRGRFSPSQALVITPHLAPAFFLSLKACIVALITQIHCHGDSFLSPHGHHGQTWPYPLSVSLLQHRIGGLVERLPLPEQRPGLKGPDY